MSQTCACGMDLGCNLHDHPAATFPATHGRASSRRRVRPLRTDLLLTGAVCLMAALAFGVSRWVFGVGVS
jgi:hypothetical protein